MIKSAAIEIKIHTQARNYLNFCVHFSSVPQWLEDPFRNKFFVQYHGVPEETSDRVVERLNRTAHNRWRCLYSRNQHLRNIYRKCSAAEQDEDVGMENAASHALQNWANASPNCRTMGGVLPKSALGRWF